jgi:hypothetical protein
MPKTICATTSTPNTPRWLRNSQANNAQTGRAPICQMDDRRFDRKLNGMTFSIKARMAINWLAYTQPYCMGRLQLGRRAILIWRSSISPSIICLAMRLIFSIGFLVWGWRLRTKLSFSVWPFVDLLFRAYCNCPLAAVATKLSDARACISGHFRRVRNARADWPLYRHLHRPI